jgi:glycosyltransferase involved in cell wall biosynthesis
MTDFPVPRTPAATERAPLLSVLLAALNEEKTIDSVIPSVLSVPIDLELIMVDDGSTDRTWALMQRHADGRRIRAYRHEAPLGKGAAIKTALKYARGSYVIIQDADMEYDPRDYTRLVEPLISGRAAVVYGTRLFSSHTAFSYWYVVGNRRVTQIASILYDVYLSDIQTAYKVFPREAAALMDLQSRGFEIDPEITAKLLRLGYRIHEVPISYIARTREEGKKVKPIDGVRALLTLARYRTWHPARKVAESALPGRVARSEEASSDSRTIHINESSGPPWYREPR